MTLKKVGTIGIFLRPKTPLLKKTFLDFRKALSGIGIKALVEKESGKMIGEKGFEAKKLAKLCQILISIGGDGTFLSLARETFLFQKPILGINSGKLGFLTETHLENIDQVVERISKQDYLIKERMVIQATIISGKTKKRFYALNELAIKSSQISKLIRLNLYIKNKYVNSYYGDGLIVATPTGSTAYNLSASGPIVFPFTNSFIFTPICSHSFSQRPLVVPADFSNIKIKIPPDEDRAIIASDGQKHFELNKESFLRIKKAPVGVKVICQKDSDFFKTLREKLFWGEILKS
ncbi:MAG: NAD(+)/NADH kinase [Patescibacteria group bacterium]|nr:NAD(+)/NADH kinase [Patescibacteria group bacterium]